ncbi:LLM class flavin-dependent oxidoreductase [Rhizobium laguerreae]|nr:LLM class flavin-dependent oxidoreductase [Rhizobium laguerreae]MBY3494594.1 LLM class flavin-dependent oxidoreductase [Rhizobium laguerreae]
MQKRLILTAGINSTGYLADSWRHVGGSPFVSSFNPAVAANYGSAPLPPREARYRQAHEFMSVVGALLDSWELRRPADPQAGLWDPDFARPIEHGGEFYNVAGPLNVPRHRRRRALIGQAGASGPGSTLPRPMARSSTAHCCRYRRLAPFETNSVGGPSRKGVMSALGGSFPVWFRSSGGAGKRRWSGTRRCREQAARRGCCGACQGC